MKERNLLIAFLCALLIILYFMVVPSSCERSDDIGYNPQIKTDIARKKMESEPIKGQIVKADTAQKKAVKKWKQAKEVVLKDTIYKHDTIIQTLIISCDSALAAKDTLLAKQALLLVNLQEENQLHETLENAQDSTIREMRKQLKKGKRKSWWNGFKTGFVTGNITGGGAVIMTTN